MTQKGALVETARDGYSQIAQYQKRLADGGEIVFRRSPPPQGSAEYPLVTVITETLNSEATIEAAIASVKQQTYPHIEHIIVDGDSKDGTFDLILKNQGSVAVVIRGKDCSPADACNKGVAVARGEYISILPSDDTYEPNYIENAVAVMRRTGCDFAYGDLVYVEEGNAALLIPGDPHYARRIRYTMPNMSAITLMHRQDAFVKIGLWDVHNRYCPDYDWLLRAHIAGLAGQYDSSIRASFSHGGISSANYFAAMARARDVAIAHGGPVFRIHWSYWRGAVQKRICDVLRNILPEPLFHKVLRRLTRTGTHPVPVRTFSPNQTK